MVQEILPNLYRTEIPLPKNPLKVLNSYIIKSPDRNLIIDTGFNRPECLEVMTASLKELEIDLNKTDIFVSHLHVDHLGLSSTLASPTSRVYFNAVEARIRTEEMADWAAFWNRMCDVYVENGFPDVSVRESANSHPAQKFGPDKKLEFTIINDGDIIEVGDYKFSCISTPGHSPGHMCLYEADKKILVAGDHILFDITPNISYWLELEDALGSYLEGLDRVYKLDVDTVLTGHRRLVNDHRGRIDELREHHRNRLNEVLVALEKGAQNILQIAPQITWDIAFKTWEEFPPAQKWFAFGEAMAHVIHLVKLGKVKANRENGKVLYSLA